jgi:lipid-A-disaccharide synthase-like uncharacterized protein
MANDVGIRIRVVAFLTLNSEAVKPRGSAPRQAGAARAFGPGFPMRAWPRRFRLSARSGAPHDAGMDWLTNLLWPGGKFLGIEWHPWKVVGWMGNAVFFSRFFVQWWATERRGRVVVPVTFWWLSLLGSGLLLSYALYRRDSVFIFAYAFTWIPYIRNLVIHRRHEEAHVDCPQCHTNCPPHARFCHACGARLNPGSPPSPAPPGA